jgi:hypothetical protein
MARRNHIMLLACACAVVGAEQLIMGALKNNGTKRLETAPRRPSLNERLTELEAKFATLEGRVQALEGTQPAPAIETDQQTTTTVEPLAETMLSQTLTSEDAITTTTPIEPTPIVSLEDMAQSLTPAPTIPMEAIDAIPATESATGV